MKRKALKRVLSMLLVVVMIIGLVPSFCMTALAGAADDYMAGKTVITKVELTIEDPELHDKIRGYDAGWIISSCVINDPSQPYYCPKDISVGMWQSYGGVNNNYLSSSEPVLVGIPIRPRTLKTGGDADYTFDLWNPENTEIWINGVKRDDAYVKVGYSEIVDIVVPYEVAEYDGPQCTVIFDTGGVGENKISTVMVGGYVNAPYVYCEGKVFEGWYEHSDASETFDFKNTQIYDDMTVYARWRDILPTEIITKLELEIDIPRLHDEMTLAEAKEAIDKVYDYDEKGYHLRYTLIRQPVDLRDRDYLNAGATTYVEVCVNAIPDEENMKHPPYTFDWDKLDDIEIWINGEHRTDAKVVDYDKDWRKIIILLPVTVVHETPSYEEVIDSEGYTRYVSDWEGLMDVMSDLNEEAIEDFGKLRVVLTEDLVTDDVEFFPQSESVVRLDVPAGLDVTFDFQDHTIGGDLDLRKTDDTEYGIRDFLLFRLGKDSSLTLEGEKSGGVSLNVIQDNDATFSAIRVMSDTPRDSRNEPYRGKLTVNGGTYTMTSETERRYLPRYLFGTNWLYRGTFIADHVETEINDGFFNLVATAFGGQATSAFATVVSTPRLHLETAPYGSVTPYIETGHTVINGGRFTAMTGGFAVHHFDSPYYIIKKKSCDYAVETSAAPENSYYYINYPTIRGGSFSGRIGFTGFTTTESEGNEYLNKNSISLMLPENYVGTYYNKTTGSEQRDLSGITWKDLHENTRLEVLSDTVLKSMTITPNGGDGYYQVKEGTDVTFKVNYEWPDWIGGSFPVYETWTVDPADQGYETYSISGSSIELSFSEKRHNSGVTLQARALIITGYGQLTKTVELPVTVHRKVDILTATPNLKYDGPDYVMDGESFYFYIREKDFYEFDASTLVVEVDGKEVKPVGDGRYIVSNVKRNTSGTLQINATAETHAYSLIKYVFGTGVIDTAKVYKGESLTLPTLKSLGIELPRNMKMDYWSVSGYGKYQPGDTIEITNAKEITVTVVLESYYAVQMQDGALAYSDENHTKLISNAKENDYIYITAPEVEGKQFYMWKYELLDETYQRPYFGDVNSTETWVMMPPSGIILTPTYVTPVKEVTIYGVTKPVAGEEFSYHYEDNVRETDKVYKSSTHWYHVVDGEDVEITYQNGVIFEAGETYRYTVLIGIPMSAEGVYGFPMDVDDINVMIEGIPASAYTLTKEFSDQWHDYVRVSMEFTISEDAGVTLSGTVTSYGDDSDEILIELIPEGLTETAYYTFVAGNTAKYNLLNVASGTYVVKVSKKNHTTREYTVVVSDTSVVQDVKIQLIGDVTGDGKFNSKDMSLIKGYIGNLKVLDEYQKKCLDVNGDGRINSKDTSKIKAHVSNVKSLWE